MPALPEQKEVATVLDAVSEVLRLRKVQLAELDNLVKSQFVEMFGDPQINPNGWPTDILGNHADVLTGYPLDSTKYTDDTTQMKICGGLIIMPDRIEWEAAKYWPQAEMKGLEKFLLSENDIVLAMDRPWIGSGFKIGQIKQYELPALLIQRTARIRGIDLKQSYILNALNHGAFARFAQPTETTVPHIAIGDIKKYPVMLPPIALQEQFSTFVEQADKSKLAIQQALDETQRLFDSLMAEYFEA